MNASHPSPDLGALRPRRDSLTSPHDGYVGSRFAEVWDVVASDPYDVLPDARLRPRAALRLLYDNLYRDARRTLEARDDLLPPFDKQVHPAGICLAGSWRITEETPYTGLFRSGAQALLIARASDAMGEQRPNKLRFMGLAGKLYATSDPQHPTPLPTANFFTLENLGGSHTPHFVDATLTTDLLPVRPHAGLLAKTLIGAVAGPAFMLADRALSPTRAMIRSLSPIAALGEPLPERAHAPVVMRLSGATSNRRFDTPDLREELAMAQHPEGLRFAIEVADRRTAALTSGFRTIGEIHFTQSVASHAGDHRLHFHHPRHRPEPA
jgi:hypothetical protein